MRFTIIGILFICFSVGLAADAKAQVHKPTEKKLSVWVDSLYTSYLSNYRLIVKNLQTNSIAFDTTLTFNEEASLPLHAKTPYFVCVKSSFFYQTSATISFDILTNYGNNELLNSNNPFVKVIGSNSFKIQMLPRPHLKLSVLDASTKRTLKATYKIRRGNKGAITILSHDNNNPLLFFPEFYGSFEVEVSAAGYKTLSKKVLISDRNNEQLITFELARQTTVSQLATDKALSKKQNLALTNNLPTETAKPSNHPEQAVTPFSNLQFETGSYLLSSQAKAELQKLVAYYTAHGIQKLHLVGYSMNIGDKRINTTLAYYRAKAVSSYLINLGIKEENLVVDFSLPTTEEEMSFQNIMKHRRVEVYLR